MMRHTSNIERTSYSSFPSHMQKWAKAFAEVRLTTVLQECQISEAGVEFQCCSIRLQGGEGVPELGRGLRWFLREVVRFHLADMGATGADDDVSKTGDFALTFCKEFWKIEWE